MDQIQTFTFYDRQVYVSDDRNVFPGGNYSIKYYCPTDSFHYLVYFISIYLEASRKLGVPCKKMIRKLSQ